MDTLWQHRINVIIPADDATALNALWTVIGPGGDAEAETFGLPCSASGIEPVTHRAISTAATETMRLLIVDTYAAELAACVKSIQPYTQNDFYVFLAANGLKVIENAA
jgi:ketopantoate reductase